MATRTLSPGIELRHVIRRATVGLALACLGCTTTTPDVATTESGGTPSIAVTDTTTIAASGTVTDSGPTVSVTADASFPPIDDTVGSDTAGSDAAGSDTAGSDTAPFAVLVFHRTAGFFHESIPAGITAIDELGSEGRFTVTATDDPAVFTDDGLAAFDVIVFLSTTGDVLAPEQERSMERFIQAGGGFVGIHAAADTEYDWAWYGGLVGAYFQSHPAPQPGSVEVMAGDHPVMAGLPPAFDVQEEWYDFRSQPVESVSVLATVDETSYTGGTMGEIHPVVWAHEYDGGRAAYLVFGHDAATFSDPTIRRLLGNALDWTAATPMAP